MSTGNRDYPAALAIEPLKRAPAATVRVPGSKSITNRALILAALSDPSQGSTLHGVLQSEDTEIMVEALRALGFRLTVDWGARTIHVCRGTSSSPIPAAEADLFLGNSGTSMRFLTALVSLGHGRYRLDGVTRMRARPLGDLLEALATLGVKASCERDSGYPPVVIDAHGINGGTVQIKGDVSSQFLSGLLMAAPFAREELLIEVVGRLVSRPYVAMTVEMMRQFGAEIDPPSLREARHGAATVFRVPQKPFYEARTYAIDPDGSAASYFFAAAAITGGEVTLEGLGTTSLQGDFRFIDLLEDMGCDVVSSDKRLTVCGKPLHGIEVDMNDMSDCVMTLAAVACFADGPSTICNVTHIRYKETDRLAAIARELRRVGAEVEEFPDGLRITPRPLHGAEIETYNDHRMAMSMALLGLAIPGIIIKNPGCVAKTYPDFFTDLDRLRN
jgi:3-phosphoshikimate 1-carboxyvinyltransferase